VSIGISVFLTEANLLRDDYFAFLDSCTSIFGKWSLSEVSPMDPNAKEILHECVLRDGENERDEKEVGVSIALLRRNFMSDSEEVGRGYFGISILRQWPGAVFGPMQYSCTYHSLPLDLFPIVWLSPIGIKHS